jgi:hypothetical protein
MKSIIYVRKKGARIHREPPGQCYTAEWRELTVGTWQKIKAVESLPAGIERAMIRYLLCQTNLIPSLERDDDGGLNDATMRKIGEVPTDIVKGLFNPVYKHSFLQKEEVAEIKDQGNRIWMMNQGNIGKIHPLLETSITALNLKERYGVPAFPSVMDIPQRHLEAMQLAMEILSNSMEMKKQQQEMRQRAMEKAGIQVGPTRKNG